MDPAEWIAGSAIISILTYATFTVTMVVGVVVCVWKRVRLEKVLGPLILGATGLAGVAATAVLWTNQVMYSFLAARFESVPLNDKERVSVSQEIGSQILSSNNPTIIIALAMMVVVTGYFTLRELVKSFK